MMDDSSPLIAWGYGLHEEKGDGEVGRGGLGIAD